MKKIIRRYTHADLDKRAQIVAADTSREIGKTANVESWEIMVETWGLQCEVTLVVVVADSDGLWRCEVDLR